VKLRLLLLGFLAQAAVANAANLTTVVESAIQHDADLAKARAGYEAAQQSIPKARAALLPKLSAGWGRAYNRTATVGLPTTDYWQNGWTVGLSQPLFDWTSWTTYKQADLNVARGAAELADAQQATILRAARAYFEVLSAADELKRTTDYAAAVASHLEVLRRQQAAGEATVIDLDEAESVSQQAQLQQVDAQNDLRLKYRAVEQATGAPVAFLSPLANTPIRPTLEPQDAERWATQARSQNYAVQRQQIQSRIAELEVSKVQAEHYPVIGLTANHTPASAAAGYAQPTSTTTAMLTVTVPLFTGGETRARQKEAVALEHKAQAELLAASRQAEAAARDHFSRFRWSLARTDRLTQLVKTSQKALESTRIGFKVSGRTSADVLRAVDQLYANQQSLMRARYESLMSLLQLKAETGTLTLSEVAQVNALLTTDAAVSP